MTTTEWNELLDTLTKLDTSGAVPSAAMVGAIATEIAETTLAESAMAPIRRATPATVVPTEPRRPSIENLVETVAGSQIGTSPVPTVSATSTSTSKSQSDDSGSVLETIAKVLPISPVLTGIFKLFGGGGDDERQQIEPALYAMPQAISVEAGLSADRSITGVSYGQQGTVRGSQPGSQSSAPVQINVQAMDSRSFLDHRDEIARAVREAMLNSHSLNDVVAEM